MISTTSGVARLIYSSDRDTNFNGTISVPAFNSNLGFVTHQIYPFIQSSEGGSSGGALPDDNSWINSQFVYPAECHFRGPNLDWNNSTKTLTVTPNNQADDPFNQILRHRYRILMVHYR
ncbi:MAG: hypothetical protein ACK4KU_14755 [Acinetobacter sp.]